MFRKDEIISLLGDMNGTASCDKTTLNTLDFGRPRPIGTWYHHHFRLSRSWYQTILGLDEEILMQPVSTLREP